MWSQWAEENPSLLEDLRQKAQGKVLTDKFASSPVSQARALADILNETAPTTQPTVEPGTDAKNALNRTLTQEELAKLRALPSLVDNVLTANKKTVASFGIKQEDWNNLSDLEKYKFLECN